MLPLRLVALRACLFLVAHGALVKSLPTLLLYGVLIPINSNSVSRRGRTSLGQSFSGQGPGAPRWCKALTCAPGKHGPMLGLELALMGTGGFLHED